jgi:hypothetical protein
MQLFAISNLKEILVGITPVKPPGMQIYPSLTANWREKARASWFISVSVSETTRTLTTSDPPRGPRIATNLINSRVVVLRKARIFVLHLIRPVEE